LELAKRVSGGDFSFDDFITQLQFVRNVGGASSMIRMIPGMSNKVGDRDLYEGEKRLAMAEKIVSAMTEEERANPELLINMVHTFKPSKSAKYFIFVIIYREAKMKYSDEEPIYLSDLELSRLKLMSSLLSS
jgi:hypothetical protein